MKTVSPSFCYPGEIGRIISLKHKATSSDNRRASSSEKPRGVLDMLDGSARPCVPERKLTFSVPMKRFEQMVPNMDASFLITQSSYLVRNGLENFAK